LIIQIIASIFFGGLFFALGYILRHWVALLYDRKPYNKNDIKNLCKDLTSFELLSLSTSLFLKVDWRDIRPEEKEDWLKIIHEIHRIRLKK